MRAFFLFILCGLGSLHAAAPVVSNISAAQRPNSRLVDITYDVAADFPTVKVSLKVSSDGGSTFTVPANTLSGAIGAGVTIGKAKKITWDAGKDWSGQYSTQMRFKVIADDGNTAPAIAARTINQGSNAGALAFTISDAQTAAGSLTLSGSSSNTTLVPNANIVFGGSGANRTVTVTPASSETGTATITVTVSDGSLTRSDSFVLSVNSLPANTAPTISDIAARTINQGSNTGAIAFTVSDAQTAAGSLTLSGISSNTTLVPNAKIVFGGSGANRTVTVTPVSGQSGTATITVTVGDGLLSTSDTFVLTVNANTAPTISDIAALTINEGGNTGALAFTVGDAQTAPGSLIVSGSSSNTTLVPNANIVFGGNGANRTVTVTPANGQSGTATITVTVSDGTLTASDTILLTVNFAGPAGMALIPQGSFTMGDSLDGDSDAPTRMVTLDAFYMDKYEVTKALWDEVRTWGLSNGYTDLAEGEGKANNHPVHTISWYDMVKWCNARSQKEGFAPAYYINDAQTTIYKTGDVDVTNAQVKWAANGYRLPTEAEWEKAARGGFSGKRFPWGDTIHHNVANYYATSYSYSYDLSASVNNYHPTYATVSMPYTSPVGAFAANGYGLFDMAGNVSEWCWDWYGTYAAGSQTNPRGSTSGTYRVLRGGYWSYTAVSCRVSYRSNDFSANSIGNFFGFRVVRSPDTPPTISDIAARAINQDSNTGAIAFTIGDAQTAAKSLTLSGGSSNTTLVPNANIVFGGSGANRTVTVTPASGQSGTVTISVTVSDGSLSSSDTFVLTVDSAPANTAPTISDIVAQTINEGGNTGALAFTIGDAQTAAGSLTLSGSSSNTTLVLNSNIVFGGSGANRTITVTPASGQSGTVTITVTVSDGTLSTSYTFLLSVNANTAPTISDIAAQTIIEGGNTGALAFTVGDAQTAAGSLTLSGSSSNTTLIPNANIVFGGSGPNRTVTVTPASGQSGTATITVTVSDGSLSNSDSFVLTVNSAPANTAPTISNIADRAINAGSNTGAIAFTIGDAQTAEGLLTLSGSSSNTTLVPNANIVFGGSGANRTVTVTPASGQSGTVTISVTVSDGSLSSSDTFVLTVSSAPANAAPTISNIADQAITEGSNTGAIAFTVGDAQTAAGSLALSGSSSNTTRVPNANIIFGGSGANRTVTVTPASSQTGTATITVTVSDGSLSASDTFLLTVNPAVPAGMALIPQGSFIMGDSLDGMSDAPTRTVTLGAFYMGKTEVTKAVWDEVRTWGLSSGYTDLAGGEGKASNHPVHTISWYDMVKWCNARSQMEGLTPVYYTNDAQTTIYKTGSRDVTNAQVKWTANGYRLPTEAEWEKAARGGLSGKRFPWGDTISHSQANYFAYDVYDYDLSGSANSLNPAYDTLPGPFTSFVGAFAANGYELQGMAGNVHEWCWDWYGTYAGGSQTNPRGSTSGTDRVKRGGSWLSYASRCRVASRDDVYPSWSHYTIGFRIARSLAP